jgi:hypothetical protein
VVTDYCCVAVVVVVDCIATKSSLAKLECSLWADAVVVSSSAFLLEAIANTACTMLPARF